MRTTHSVRNIAVGIISQVVIALLGFISRKIFLDSLGAEYLGVNGLLTNVLSLMALVEGGIGISIVYNLYKPLAEKDRNKVIALVQLYKKAYGILAFIILLISICLFPFLGHLMKEADSITNIGIIYFLFVAKTMISYFNAHKWSLINADQRGYVLTSMNLLFQVFTTIAKIIVLLLTQSFILYLLVEFIIYGIQTIINGRIVEKRYSYIKTKEKYTLDKDTMENIKKNVKAMLLHNIGGFCVFGTDNILISSFISIATVGIYSNYTMITQQLSALIGPVLGGIGASVGNLIATESGDKNYSIFKISFLVNFWVYSLAVIFSFNLLEPFISWWLGKQYLLDNFVFIFILVNFYLTGMRSAISTFKNRAGLFEQDKYASIFEGVINLVSSIILLKFFGLAGIFIGTTISTLLTVFWTQPVIVYRHLFKKSVKVYFLRYILYALLTFLTCIITKEFIEKLVSGTSFFDLVIKGLISIIIPNILYIIIFYRNKEFIYVRTIVINKLRGLKVRSKISLTGS